MWTWASRGTMLATMALGLGSAGCWLTVDSEKLFGPDTRHVVVEIAYGPGAEPITERADGSRYFMRAKTNFERLFEGTQKTVEFPTTLDEMHFDPAITGEVFTRDDLTRLGLAARRHEPSDDTAVIVVIYVPGKIGESIVYGDTESYKGVTGLSAINMRRPIDSGYPEYHALLPDIEQIVLIHELGHQVGLVDAGLPMATPHLDDGDGGAHCSNPGCVMHTGSGIRTRNLPSFWTDDGTILFGDECLADIAAVVGATR